MTQESTYSFEPPSGGAVSSALLHSLRTPLNQILGYCELLRDELASRNEPGLLADVSRIEAAGQDLLGLIESSSPTASIPRPGETAESKLSPIELMVANAAAVVADQPAQDDLAYLQAYAPPSAQESGRILVVDDKLGNRDVLSRMLRKQGFEVAEAGDGSDALTMLSDAADQGKPFEVVLLDIVMPDVNGWEVLQKVKADPKLQNTAIIMISGVDDTDTIVRCLELGAADFVPKPFVPAILKARVSASIRAAHSTGVMN